MAPGYEVAAAVRAGTVSARDVLEASLQRIAAVDPIVNAFTDVTVERARIAADRIDARDAPHRGPLAGVPFAAKNLFDIAGLPTRAGSLINRELPPSKADSPLIRRLEEAGAILVGGLNMGEYAYDFTGENIHDGPSRNPHDLQHMSGGSSGGSGAAVAAGLVPIALGSDTNGSIRVPSSFCGLFGLKPTFGRLTRSGTFPFVSSFDHLGPLARTVTDLATSYDVMQGHDPTDPFSAVQPVELSLPSLGAGTAGLRIATASGYFAENGLPEAFAAVETIAAALGTARTVEIPEAARARAAGFLITMAEGSALHIERLQRRPQDFDPDTRDRFLAGSLLPASWIVRAQKFRRWYRDEVLRLFNSVDLILAPATPTRAPRISQKTFVLGGTELPVRANIGLFTQPISFIGLPVCSVPVWTKGEALPIGVQIIAAPWREDLVLRAAYALERAGIAVSPCADI